MEKKINSKKAIIISTIVTIAVMLVVGIVFAVFEITTETRNKSYEFTQFTMQDGRDRIHFMPTGGSDAILLESDGKFALIDCAEDNDNPRNFSGLQLKGYEEEVINYVKKIAGNESGKVTLEFVLGTHCHSDHIGGFDTLINDKDITVKTAYLKRYYEERISDYEVEGWDNKENYDAMIKAVQENNVALVQDLENLEFKMGNFDIQLFNGKEADPDKKVGENENSIATLVSNGKFRALLVGDLNNIDGDETEIAPLIGKVDILKVGHHGYSKSSSAKFLRTIAPDISIITNKGTGDYNVALRITFDAKSAFYSTGENQGIVLDLTEDKLGCFNNIV